MLEWIIITLCLLILGVAAWACRILKSEPHIIVQPKTVRCWICGDNCLDKSEGDGSLDKQG